jgi:hypothetical protein
MKIHLISQQLIRPTPLNLFALMAPFMLRVAPLDSEGSYPTLAAVDPLPLDVWTAPRLVGPNWQARTPLWVWLLVPIITLSVAGLLTYCLFLRYRCQGITMLVQKWQHSRCCPMPARRTKRTPSSGEVGATAPLAIDQAGGTDAMFHELMMNSLGVKGAEPTTGSPAPNYSQLRSLLATREEKTPSAIHEAEL